MWSGSSTPISIDIETWGKKLSIVGFGVSAEYAIVVDLIENGRAEWTLPLLRDICGSSREKIFHNGYYDMYWLALAGIEVRNWKWDTMHMAHALNPTDEFALWYQCSIWLDDYVYWKDRARDAEEAVASKHRADLMALRIYNGLDCVRTWELWQVLWREMLRLDKDPSTLAL